MTGITAQTRNSAAFQLLAALDNYDAALAACVASDSANLAVLERALDQVRQSAVRNPQLSAHWAQLLIEHHRLRDYLLQQEHSAAPGSGILHLPLERVVDNARRACLRQMRRN